MIPSIIHQTWKTSEIPNAFKSLSLRGMLHPDYTFMFWTDEDNLSRFSESTRTCLIFTTHSNPCDEVLCVIRYSAPLRRVLRRSDVMCYKPLSDLPIEDCTNCAHRGASQLIWYRVQHEGNCHELVHGCGKLRAYAQYQDNAVHNQAVPERPRTSERHRSVHDDRL